MDGKKISEMISDKVEELEVLLKQANEMGITVEINNGSSSSNVKQDKAINLKVYSITNLI